MVAILFSKNNGSQILLNKSKVYYLPWGFPCGSAGKESACNAGDLGWEDCLEKGKAAHSSILAWTIP